MNCYSFTKYSVHDLNVSNVFTEYTIKIRHCASGWDTAISKMLKRSNAFYFTSSDYLNLIFCVDYELTFF